MGEFPQSERFAPRGLSAAMVRRLMEWARPKEKGNTGIHGRIATGALIWITFLSVPILAGVVKLVGLLHSLFKPPGTMDL